MSEEVPLAGGVAEREVYIGIPKICEDLDRLVSLEICGFPPGTPVSADTI